MYTLEASTVLECHSSEYMHLLELLESTCFPENVLANVVKPADLICTKYS